MNAFLATQLMKFVTAKTMTAMARPTKTILRVVRIVTQNCRGSAQLAQLLVKMELLFATKLSNRLKKSAMVKTTTAMVELTKTTLGVVKIVF
jgi:hypothetical protein